MPRDLPRPSDGQNSKQSTLRIVSRRRARTSPGQGRAKTQRRDAMDHYSYTQLSTYLQCPLKYKYHYLDGWTEREDKASLAFGRVFQMGVEAQFLADDSVQFFTQQWAKLKDVPLEYAHGDSWEKMLEQ